MPFERLTNALSAAKKAWQAQEVNEKQPTAPAALPTPNVNLYYVDTISKAEEELPVITHKGRLECRREEMSAELDAALRQDEKDPNKLQSVIYGIIMLMMRLAAKSDQENIYKITLKVKTQAHEIKATYNRWEGVTIAVISAAVSIGGGLAGLSPFVPTSLLSSESSKILFSASQSIGTAGTGLSGIGSIFNNKSEGERQVLNTYSRQTQDAGDEKKGSKQNKNASIKDAKDSLAECARAHNEAVRAMTSA